MSNNRFLTRFNPGPILPSKGEEVAYRSKKLIFLGFFGFLVILGFSFHSWAQGKAVQGKAVYDKYCSSCHGRQGEGLGPVSGLPNFSDHATLGKKSDQDLFNKVTMGGKGSGMPAWKGILNDQERWDVVAYIRTLAKP